MKSYNCAPMGVCAKRIIVNMEDDNTIGEVTFIGGCPGNQKAIAALIKGKHIEEVQPLLQGIPCGNKGTSCADQLSKLLLSIKEGSLD